MANGDNLCLFCLKELNVKLSKQRLQAKSKIASLKKERDEARRVESDVLERVSSFLRYHIAIILCILRPLFSYILPEFDSIHSSL